MEETIVCMYAPVYVRLTTGTQTTNGWTVLTFVETVAVRGQVAFRHTSLIFYVLRNRFVYLQVLRICKECSR